MDHVAAPPEEILPASVPKQRSLLRRILHALLRILALLCGALLFFQHKLIYHPRAYDPGDIDRLPEGTVQLPFTTSAGKQVAFYVPPTRDPDTVPDDLWVMFAGNASLAGDWRWLIEEYRRGTGRDRTGFLLVDYPGYGLCEGRPTPARILEASAAAFSELARHLDTTTGDLEPRLNALGHSLGAAAATQFAVRHPVKRLVLASPFTSTQDMARRMVGWPLCLLLMHRFDNVANLRQVAARPDPPRVLILHGLNDRVIPVEMGRELATVAPGITTYVEGRTEGHEIFTKENQRKHLFPAMTAEPGKANAAPD